jgi:hypothetical protein
MGIKRLEAELQELSQRVSKLEARAEWIAERSPKSKRAGTPPQGSSSEGPLPIEPEPEGWPEIDTIEFRSVADFERDLARLAAAERQRVVKAINSKCPLWLKDRRAAEKEFERPYRFPLWGELESSLCELRVGKDRRVILAVDDDPIFGQVIITLMRVVPTSERKGAYDELARLLYPGQVVDVQISEA